MTKEYLEIRDHFIHIRKDGQLETMTIEELYEIFKRKMEADGVLNEANKDRQ